jgi:hypothetical protein
MEVTRRKAALHIYPKGWFRMKLSRDGATLEVDGYRVVVGSGDLMDPQAIRVAARIEECLRAFDGIGRPKPFMMHVSQLDKNVSDILRLMTSQGGGAMACVKSTVLSLSAIRAERKA